MNHTCHTCKYRLGYVDGDGSPLYMECRRFPPAAQRVPAHYNGEGFPALSKIVIQFPRVEPYDWCWEFKKEKP